MTPEKYRDLIGEAIKETFDGKDMSGFTQDDIERLFVECVACYLAKVVASEMGIG
jgi:hypothetical protein